MTSSERRPVAAGGLPNWAETRTRNCASSSPRSPWLSSRSPLPLSAPDAPEPRRPERRRHRRLPPRLLVGPRRRRRQVQLRRSPPTRRSTRPIYQLNGTKNTRATPDKTVPNGTYYWRVQAVDVERQHLRAGRSLARSRSSGPDSPSSTTPDDGATISVPRATRSSSAGTRSPGAAKYHVYICRR